MWWGSVTLSVKGKEVPRDVTRVRSRITQDEVKSGVKLRTQTGSNSERHYNKIQWKREVPYNYYRTKHVKEK